MKSTSSEFAELRRLMDVLCDDQLSLEQTARLESLVLNQPGASAFYLSYLDLHGTLCWDTAGGTATLIDTESTLSEFKDADADLAASAPDGFDAALEAAVAFAKVDSLSDSGRADRVQPGIQDLGPHKTRHKKSRIPAYSWPSRNASQIASVAAAACFVVAVGIFSLFSQRPGSTPLTVTPVGVPERTANLATAGKSSVLASTPETPAPVVAEAGTKLHSEPVGPANLAASNVTPLTEPKPGTDPVGIPAVAATTNRLTVGQAQPGAEPAATASDAAGGGSAEVLLTFINQKVRAGWEAAGVQPSQSADDAEWLRRVYLDLAGYIPPVEVLEEFLASRDKSKRANIVDRLLDDPAYVRNWTSIWTNLLIGQVTPADVNRAGLQAFLRQAFGRNRPWNDVVYDLVSAEGRADENGAVNFLLAHLNGGAIPATAVTSRLLLGRQIQCTQCHNHPSNDWKQNEFWELNSFFQQARKVRHEKYDPASGKMVFDVAELTSRDVDGPIFFETRNGLMKVAFPKYGNQEVDPGPLTNRRTELARLLTQSSQPLVAEAMVNRMWGHFFGEGFTRQVDDMGPHSPPTHPELLARLASEFAGSGYDLKQLVRWICNSEAYQLTSRFNSTNSLDDPSAGTVPLFSHMYVKPMTAEQVYDSLVMATRGQQSGAASGEEFDKPRQAWLEQFVTSFQTEENNEESTFNGSIPQSLVMMNGALVDQAVSGARGTYLHKILTEKGSDSERLKKLCLSALSRYPTSKELAAARKLLHAKSAARAHDPDRQLAASTHAFQDVYWALLNSNEFILNH